jgi:hypothetical protein
MADQQAVEEIRYLEEQTLGESGSRDVSFLVKGVSGQRSVAPLSQTQTFFADVPEDEVSQDSRSNGA